MELIVYVIIPLPAYLLMERKRPTNIGADLLMQHLPPETETQQFTTAIEGIIDQTARNGRVYKAIEFVDPQGEIRKVAVWNKKLLEGLAPGQLVDLHLEKKGAFWNLGSLTRVDVTDANPKAFTPVKEPEIAPVEVLEPPKSPTRLLHYPTIISPDSALVSAVRVVTTFREVLEPKTKAEIMDQIMGFYQAFLEFGERSQDTK